MKGLGVTINLSISFHPQTDGQTERVNQVLEAYLRNYVNAKQNNWSELLPVAQLAYNTSHHTSIGMFPFKANYGYDPKEIPSQGETTPVPQVNKHLNDLSTIQAKLKNTLNKSVQSYKKFSYIHHREPEKYFPRSLVFLDACNLHIKWPCQKLGPKKIGPLEIIQKISPLTYQVCLPKGSTAHDVFHLAFSVATTDPQKISPRPNKTPHLW